MPFDGDWHDATVSRWHFKGRFYYCHVMLLLPVSGVSEK